MQPLETADVDRVSRRDDFLTMAFGLWMMIGLMVDANSHSTDPGLESFWTSSHALFYSGFTATALWVIRLCLVRRRATGGILHWAPLGYRLALIGVGLFAPGGVVSAVWHPVFGVETMAPMFRAGLFSVPWGSPATQAMLEPLLFELSQFPLSSVFDRVMSVWFAYVGCKDQVQAGHTPMFDERSTRRWPNRRLRRRHIVDFGEHTIEPVLLSSQRSGATDEAHNAHRRAMVGTPGMAHPQLASITKSNASPITSLAARTRRRSSSRVPPTLTLMVVNPAATRSAITRRSRASS